MRRKRIRKLLLLVLVLCFSGLFLMRRMSAPGPAEMSAPREEGPSREAVKQELSAFSIHGRSPQGARSWQIEGVSAEIMDDKIRLKELSAFAMTEHGKVELVSDEGLFYREAGIVELIGHVRMNAPDGVVLSTDRARWVQGAHEIETDEPVHIERGDLRAKGTGGWASPAENAARLERDVWVILGGGTEVTCKGPLKVFYEKNRAEFYEEVVVVDKEGRLIADTLVVHFDPETQRIGQVVAEGNVMVRRGESYTVSDRAVYTESTASAKLTGGARVIIDPEQVEELDGLGGLPWSREGEVD